MTVQSITLNSNYDQLQKLCTVLTNVLVQLQGHSGQREVVHCDNLKTTPTKRKGACQQEFNVISFKRVRKLEPALMSGSICATSNRDSNSIIRVSDDFRNMSVSCMGVSNHSYYPSVSVFGKSSSFDANSNSEVSETSEFEESDPEFTFEDTVDAAAHFNTYKINRSPTMVVKVAEKMKKVKFKDQDLVKVIEFEDDDDSKQNRKIYWETFAVDRFRFKERINRTGDLLSPILDAGHREKVFRRQITPFFESTYDPNYYDLPCCSTEASTATSEENSSPTASSSKSSATKKSRNKKRRRKSKYRRKY